MKSFLLLFLPALLIGQVTITGPTTAQVGQTITFTSSAPVTVTLEAHSVGTLGGTLTNTTTWTYTAPASVVATNQAQGCQILPNNNIFNQDISGLPVHASSATWNAILGTGISVVPDQNWGIDGINANTPTIAIKAYYGGSGNIPTPQFPEREGGWLHSVDEDGGTADHHNMEIVGVPVGGSQAPCTVYEVYDYLINNTSPTQTCRDSSPGCNASSFTTYGPGTYVTIPNGGTDQAGYPVAALTLRSDDVRNGSTHALRASVNGNQIQFNGNFWPSQNAGNGSGVPYGVRWRLRNCAVTSSPCKDIAGGGYSAWAQNILNEMYYGGIFLADGNVPGGVSVSTSADMFADYTVGQAVTQAFAGLTLADFDVVDESSLEYNPGGYWVCPQGRTTCGPAQNQTNTIPVSGQVWMDIIPYPSGTPQDYAIALQGVTIGLPYQGTFYTQTSTVLPLPYWVNGTSNTAVTCSLQSGVGTLSGCTYTAPSSLGGGSTAVVKLTSQADTNVSNYAYIYLFAPDPADGHLRISYGTISPCTDTNGHTWSAGGYGRDISLQANIYDNGSGEPTWFSGGTPPDMCVRSTGAWSYGDVHWHFYLPNGNYIAHVAGGAPFNSLPLTRTFALPPNSGGRQLLAGNGVIGYHAWNMQDTIWGSGNYKYYPGVPGDAYLPCQVTNNLCELDILGVSYQAIDQPLWGTGQFFAAQFSAIELIPDTTPAYWTIDNTLSSTGTIAPSGTLQLFVVPWYTTVNDPVWSVTSGTGSVNSSTGLFTAPSSAPPANQPTTVCAQSASQPGTFNACTSLYISGSNTFIW